MRSTYILIFSFLFSLVQIQAQTSSVTGRVVDDAKIPLYGALIEINGQYESTNQDGYYTIAEIPAGSYTLLVTYIGFEDVQVDVLLEAGETQVVDLQMKAGVELQEVVVTGQLRGQAKALNTQLQRDNITNIIAADQIGRFPDQNIGDAMKRIPGINVQYDQGEARFGNIRGTAPELNSVTINGERIPSAEAEIRSIQLDLIPSDMIQAVEVNKAVTPDMDADAIGGSVNLVTRSAPSGERISATLGGGYNLLAEEPTFNASLIYGNRFVDDKLGVILSASYLDNNLGSDNIEAEWTFDDENDNGIQDNGEEIWTEEFQIRQYYLQRIRQSYSATLDYAFDSKNRVTFRGIFNDRKDWESRYRTVFADIEQDDNGQWVSEIERQTKGGIEDDKFQRLEHQKMMTFSLGGEHQLGKVALDWSGSYSKANEDRPNERYFEIVTDGSVPVDLNLSSFETPMIDAVESQYQNPSSSWELSEITEEFQYTEDIDMNGRINATVPLRTGEYKSTLKFGGRLRLKDKNRNNDFYEYSPLDDNILANGIGNAKDLSKDNFLPGDYEIGEFVDEEYLGDLQLQDATLFEEEQDLSELAGNFDATENIYAGYVMIDQQLSSKFKFIAGVRLEQTEVEYQGFVYDDAEETLTQSDNSSSNYLNVLPGLHLRYNLDDRSVLRFAYTNTLARPNYFDLVPFREIEDGEVLSIGNPDLDATTSMNFDLMFEKYFGNVGLLSGGVFYKDVSDFIVTQQFADFEFEGMVWDNFSQPINGGNATLYGIELSFQRQLDFISPALKGLGIYANYTYIQSEISDFNVEGREDEDLNLPGSPDHTLNLSLSYDAPKWTARISLNYASSFLDELGESSFFDRYYDEASFLDFNMNYSLSDKFVIYANANNLLDQPLRYYQGSVNRTMQDEHYNVRFDLGVKYDLFR